MEQSQWILVLKQMIQKGPLWLHLCGQMVQSCLWFLSSKELKIVGLWKKNSQIFYLAENIIVRKMYEWIRGKLLNGLRIFLNHILKWHQKRSTACVGFLLMPHDDISGGSNPTVWCRSGAHPWLMHFSLPHVNVGINKALKMLVCKNWEDQNSYTTIDCWVGYQCIWYYFRGYWSTFLEAWSLFFA